MWFITAIVIVRVRDLQLTVSFRDTTHLGCYSIVINLLIVDVRKLCTLHMDMSDFDFKSFPKFVNNIGKEYRNVDSCLTMNVTVSSVEWSVVCQGKPVKVRVEYEDIISAAMIPT
jgi:hypothetical protein